MKAEIEGRFLIDHFNGTFFACLALTLLFLAVFWLIFRKRTDMTKRTAVAVLYLLTFAFFFLYKYWISVDEAYSVITEEAGNGAFSWWQELPLHLCNINLILIPVAMFTKNRPLESFCFFMAPIGAFFAMLAPSVGFYGYSIFVPRVFGYYLTHLLILISGPMISMLGIFAPRFRDFPLTVAFIAGISLAVFGISMLMRATGVNPHANYFYSIEPAPGSPLVTFHRWIPVPYLYLLPGVLILLPYMALVTLPFERARMNEAKAKKAGAAAPAPGLTDADGTAETGEKTEEETAG